MSVVSGQLPVVRFAGAIGSLLRKCIDLLLVCPGQGHLRHGNSGLRSIKSQGLAAVSPSFLDDAPLALISVIRAL